MSWDTVEECFSALDATVASEWKNGNICKCLVKFPSQKCRENSYYIGQLLDFTLSQNNGSEKAAMENDWL